MKNWEWSSSPSSYNKKTSSPKESEDLKQEDLELSLAILLRATEWLPKALAPDAPKGELKQFAELVIRGWESKAVLLNALWAILEHQRWNPADRLVETCYQLAERLCAVDLDGVCLQQALAQLTLHLPNVLKPDQPPESEPELSLPLPTAPLLPLRAQAYLQHAANVCRIAFQPSYHHDIQRVTHALRTGLVVATGTVRFRTEPTDRHSHSSLIQALLEAWTNAALTSQIAEQHQLVTDYVDKLLRHAPHLLGDPRCLAFVRAALPLALSNLDAPALVATIIRRLPILPLSQALALTSPDRPTHLPQLFAVLLNDLRALQLLASAGSEELRSSILSSSELKAGIAQLQPIANALPVQQAEELGSLLAALSNNA